MTNPNDNKSGSNSQTPTGSLFRSKQYLEYLDKEMTIMGLLSAVAIAAPAAVLNTLVGAKDGIAHELWMKTNSFVAAGSASCVLAALLFYRQRSLLAWYYGQICLTEALEEDGSLPNRIREWLRDADSWETWRAYSWGFTALVGLGLLNYLLSMIFYLVSPTSTVSVTTVKMQLLIISTLIVIAGAIAILQGYVFRRHKFDDSPWHAWLCDVKYLFRKKRPHDDVFTRLQPSQIHGVGVFAIQEIPEGKYIFDPDSTDLITIRSKTVDHLPDAAKQLYKDFCVLRGDRYLCPQSFNQLTPAWFLNQSGSPNVAADLSLNFYACRRIQAGEELTADYKLYSDNPAPVK